MRKFGHVCAIFLLTIFTISADAAVAAPTDANAPAPLLPVSAFAQLGRFDQPKLSPDGTKIAHITDVNGRKVIVIRPADDPKAPVVLIPPDMKSGTEVRGIWWATNDRLLYSVGKTFDRGSHGRFTFSGRTRETRLFSVATTGLSTINVVSQNYSNLNGTLIARAEENHVAVQQDNVIFTGLHNPESFLLSIDEDSLDESGTRVRRIDPYTGKFTAVAGGLKDIDYYRADLAGDVRIAFGERLENNIRKQFLEYRNPDDGKWMRFLVSRLLDRDTQFLGFTPDPHFGYVSIPVEGRQSLVKWDMISQKMAEVLVHDPNADFRNGLEQDTLYDETGNLIAIRMDRSEDPWVYFDPKWKTLITALRKAVPGYDLSVISVSRNGEKLILRAENASEPGIYLVFDRIKKSFATYDYEYTGLGPENAAPKRAISYKARDGLQIEAFLTIPRGSTGKNLPTVILPHGGPWANDDAQYDWWSQFLANRGYAVLQPNFRGSTGYGVAFEAKGDGQWGLAMQDDITDGTQWMIDQGIADPKRICIAGGSYGGYAALMAAVKTPSLFKCASSLAGVSDIVALLRDDDGSYKSEDEVLRIGDTDKDNAKLRANSPINNIDKIMIPIQLVHAKDDLRVDIRQSLRMRNKLHAAGKNVEYVEIEKGEHFLETGESRRVYLTALEAFLKENIGPGRN